MSSTTQILEFIARVTALLIIIIQGYKVIFGSYSDKHGSFSERNISESYKRQQEFIQNAFVEQSKMLKKIFNKLK